LPSNQKKLDCIELFLLFNTYPYKKKNLVLFLF